MAQWVRDSALSCCGEGSIPGPGISCHSGRRKKKAKVLLFGLERNCKIIFPFPEQSLNICQALLTLLLVWLVLSIHCHCPTAHQCCVALCLLFPTVSPSSKEYIWSCPFLLQNFPLLVLCPLETFHIFKVFEACNVPFPQLCALTTISPRPVKQSLVLLCCLLKRLSTFSLTRFHMHSSLCPKHSS